MKMPGAGFWGGLTALLAGTAMAGKELADVELHAASGTRVEISSVFDPPPPTGYAPVRVVATSGAGGATRWTLRFESEAQPYVQRHAHESAFAFDVPARATETRAFLVPVAVSYGAAAYGHSSGHQMRISLSVSGLGSREFFQHDDRAAGIPAIAIGKILADNALSRLESEVESRNRRSKYGSRGDTFGSRFEVDELPEDWRGLSGFDFLMLTHAEWQALRPGARLAVMQWVRLGGRLHLYLSPGVTAASLGLPMETPPEGATLSLGSVRLIPWDGKNLPAKETVDRYWGEVKREERISETYAQLSSGKPSWPLLLELGNRSFASWQVLVFLIVFGVLVGPVNLFVLAPSSRRHRLFVTTPLLSLGASVAMFGILLLQDGTGGIGRRFIVIDFEPGDTTAYVTQEQTSRSGMLLSSGFEMKQAAVVEPVALPDTPWVKLKATQDSQAAQLRQAGSQFSGNFFQSRAEQGQLIRAAISSRARMELKSGRPPEAAPELISALGFTVQELFFVDAQGEVWKAAGSLATGQLIGLEKSDTATLRTWWKAASAKASSPTRTELEKPLEKPRSVFFAKAAQAPGFVVDTLNSIRWSEDEVIVFGTVPTP